MSEELVLQGKVMWSYDYELQEIKSSFKAMVGLGGIGGPLHNHDGFIALTDDQLIIESENNESIVITLAAITQIYLGFDDNYTVYSAKNGGLSWQPLRIEYLNSNSQPVTLYLIIDYMLFFCRNQKWYDTLVAMLQ